jgi:plastocyanin
MRRLPIALLAVAALAAAGCGSDDDEDTGANSPVRTAKPAGASGQQVNMVSGNEFQPRQVAVAVGETVTWTNVDSVPHNAVAKEGEGPKSELLPKGGKYSFTPDSPGEIRYVCTIHPGMEGTLSVRGG